MVRTVRGQIWRGPVPNIFHDNCPQSKKKRKREEIDNCIQQILLQNHSGAISTPRPESHDSKIEFPLYHKLSKLLSRRVDEWIAKQQTQEMVSKLQTKNSTFRISVPNSCSQANTVDRVRERDFI